MTEDRARPRIVVIGAGFGGLACVRAMAALPVDITLVDRRNFHLFQPLLYQVATAALSPADIAWPIRSILSRQPNVQVQLGRVVGIDTHARKVLVHDGRQLAYDILVVATGARHSYFGHDEWEEAAPGLKKIDDATMIRQRILLAFEQAEVEPDPDERRHLLTFVVVGGGPTGVEMAGAIAELARHALARDFQQIDPRQARIVLVEAGERLLPSFPEVLSEATRCSLEALGVQVRLGHPVTECDREGVAIGGERIGSRVVIWGAGVVASPAARWLGGPADRAGRVVVDSRLRLRGHPDVFVIGDTAVVSDERGQVPGTAPAAKQMGHYVARAIAAQWAGSPLPEAFRYRHAGSLATIGRRAAVAEFGRFRLAGAPAWILWATAHVWFLIGWRHRLVVALNWLWNYVTFERGARLITGASSEAMGAAMQDPERLPPLGEKRDEARPEAVGAA